MIEDKIKNLLAKATDPAATPNEAESALKLARKLMVKFDITEADIAARGDAAFKEWREAGRKTKFGTVLHPVDKYCGRVIALFCGCKAWITRRVEGPDEYVYFGVDSDVEFARHLRDAVKRHFDMQWEIFSQDARRVKDRASARQSFSIAFADALNERLNDWSVMRQDGERKLDTSNALVAKRLDLVEAELKRRGIVLGHGTTKSMGDNMQAAGAGTMAGRTASTGRGLTRAPKAIAAQ